MSLSGVNPDIDDSPVPAQPEPSGTGRRWSVTRPPRLSLPVTGMLIFAGIRVLSVAFAAFLLGHGKYQLRQWSLVRWMKSSDGGHYTAIAAHGYAYPAGQLAHASVFSWFPGYPAVIDSIAWLPGLTLVGAGLVVTAIAGLAAAWGLTALGMKLTGDPRISLLMVAIWAVAPSSTVLSMVYAEALFCALAIWALVALVGRRWLTAGLLTLAAGTVRSTALALVLTICVAALIAMIQAVRARQPFTMWWRPLAGALLAPLGLLGYLGYVALATHRLDGWFWVEKHTCHMVFDWGTSTLRVAKGTLLDAPSVAQVLVVGAIAAAALLLLWSLTERIPVYLHVYTIVVVFLALTTSANWISSKPRFLLPAVLLALPLARLLAPVRTSVLVPLIGILAVATTWFGLYLTVIVRWTP
jgi:Mannosyltransferase (PIG-V)